MVSATLANPEVTIAQDLASLTHRPLDFCNYAFDWPSVEGQDGPYDWQRKILEILGTHLQKRETRYQPLKIAVASGHGIGKSALVAMVMSWALSTCEDTKIVVTANTATQLATKTVPRVEEWFRRAINQHWWDLKATAITAKDEEHARTWRADYIPWSEQNVEAFAGLHNQGKRIVLIFDEASGIHDKIWETGEGALTDSETEIIWLAFGNPTQNTGRFRECFGRYKHRWITFQIDSRTVPGTNKEEIARWQEDYGEDSDWFRVRVRGEFPRAGANQFIPSDVVARARAYKAQGYDRLPRFLSVDVARFGDDQTVLIGRQGRFSRIYGKYRGLDTEQVAQRVIEARNDMRPDAVIVDGDGLGAGVVDHLKARGYGEGLFEFHGGATARDKQQYFNKRVECWGLMREWLKEGAQIDDDPELDQDLTAPTYAVARGKTEGCIILESKDDMKKRGLSSPDTGDALAMSFAVQMAIPKREEQGPKRSFSPWS